MKNLLTLSQYAIRLPTVPPNTEFGGCFEISGAGVKLRVIASSGYFGWDHASVSTPKRCPTWGEMCKVKNLFWEPEDMVMQVHPPESEWISNHPFCLHLFRPLDPGVEIPKPPAEMVGIRGMTEEQTLKLTLAEGLKLRIDAGARYEQGRATRG